MGRAVNQESGEDTDYVYWSCTFTVFQIVTLSMGAMLFRYFAISLFRYFAISLFHSQLKSQFRTNHDVTVGVGGDLIPSSILVPLDVDSPTHPYTDACPHPGSTYLPAACPLSMDGSRRKSNPVPS